MATIIKVPMAWVKETKNCHRYEAVATALPTLLQPPVDCIYLQKSALAGAKAPTALLVEVHIDA